METAISHKVILRPLFVFFVGVVFWAGFADSFYAPKTVVAALFLAWLFIDTGSGAIAASPLRLPGALLLLWSALGLVFQGRMRFAGGNLLGFAAAVLMILILSGDRRSPDRGGIIKGAAAALAAVSIYAVLQFYGIGLIERFRDAPVPYSTLGNRNYVSDFIILLLPLMFFGVKMKKPLECGAAFFGVWALFLSRSWRAVPAFGAVLAVYWIFSAGRHRRVFAALTACAVIAGGIAAVLNHESLAGRHLRPRLLMWRVSLEMFADAPVIGQGTGTFAWVYPDYQARFLEERPASPLAAYADSPEHANNEYVQMVAERGIIGLLLFLWFIAAWFRNADLSDKKFALPVAAGAAGVLVSAFFGFPLHRPSTLFTLALLLGCSLRPDAESSPVKRRNILLHRNFKVDPMQLSGGTGGKDMLSPDWGDRERSERREGRKPLRKFRVLKRATNLSALMAAAAVLTALLITFSQVFFERAQREFDAGNYAAASATASRAAAWSLIPGRMYFLKGRAFYRRALYQDAVENYTKAGNTYNNVSLYYNRALAYLGMNMFPEAAADLEKALSILPGYLNAGRLLNELNRFTGAEGPSGGGAENPGSFR